MSERNVYQQPDDRILLRTADVYQTEVEDEVSTYSEKLLGIVADFKNSGVPDRFNAQSMVGKSKRGEVACRLFAAIDGEMGRVQAAGFKARGCLAMTGCASAACQHIEGKSLEEVLALSTDDVSELVDGVPTDKVHALYFAVCAMRALVGDYLLKNGASLAELDEAVPCDPLSIPCIMAEHCSLRESRLELRMAQEEAENELAQHNAVATALDRVRANTRHGLLTAPADWADLVPAHLMPDEFEELVMESLQEDASEEAAELLAAQAPSSGWQTGDVPASRPSEYANRGVGIPRMFAARSQAEQSPAREVGAEAGEELASDAIMLDSDVIEDEAAKPVTMPVMEAAEADGTDAQEEDDFDLVPPEGYKLVEVDGQWGLVECDEPARPRRQPLSSDGIRVLRGGKTVYLYDGSYMKPSFARWAFLAQEDDPLATFAYCVREDSRVYPRPLPEANLANRPFSLDANTVSSLWNQASQDPAYADLARLEASNGDVYYYSTDYLSAEMAQSLAEWASVERFMNV